MEQKDFLSLKKIKIKQPFVRQYTEFMCNPSQLSCLSSFSNAEQCLTLTALVQTVTRDFHMTLIRILQLT